MMRVDDVEVADEVERDGHGGYIWICIQWCKCALFACPLAGPRGVGPRRRLWLQFGSSCALHASILPILYFPIVSPTVSMPVVILASTSPLPPSSHRWWPAQAGFANIVSHLECMSGQWPRPSGWRKSCLWSICLSTIFVLPEGFGWLSALEVTCILLVGQPPWRAPWPLQRLHTCTSLTLAVCAHVACTWTTVRARRQP